MYTATMRYYFKPEDFETACEVWHSKVLASACKQSGFVRMQLLENPEEGVALAISTWKSREDAQAFMKTGIFKELLHELADLTVKAPDSEIWNLKFYKEK
jgi:heme-degrading monooxygenase HmoA